MPKLHTFSQYFLNHQISFPYLQHILKLQHLFTIHFQNSNLECLCPHIQ